MERVILDARNKCGALPDTGSHQFHVGRRTFIFVSGIFSFSGWEAQILLLAGYDLIFSCFRRRIILAAGRQSAVAMYALRN
ncbi:MAG: hypothetical protein OEL66_01595 [Desulfobulbaceae bacterium]|nr:hypothetical protein [Desulfobulbaceae bacterium]